MASRSSGIAGAISFRRWRRLRRVVALDLRGYNLSDKPASGYDLATLTADVRGVIEALGERQADVVGHDWGGVIAWALAMREPDYCGGW